MRKVENQLAKLAVIWALKLHMKRKRKRRARSRHQTQTSPLAATLKTDPLMMMMRGRRTRYGVRANTHTDRVQ